MNEILLNQIAVGIFLIITLVVGLRSKRAGSMREYFAMGRSLSSGVLMISLIATLISSRDIWIERSFSKGYITLAIALCTSTMLVLLGWFVYPKLTYFRQQSTFDGIIAHLYGVSAGRLASFISLLACMLVMIAQLRYSGELAGKLGIDDARTIIITLGLITTLYTCMGGLRSVAYTDVLQFGCIAICSMVFLIIHLSTRGKTIDIVVPHHYAFWEHPHLARRASRTFFWGLWPTFLVMPPIIQRVLLFKRKEHIKPTFLGISVTYMAFVALMFFIGSSLAFRYRAVDRRIPIGEVIGMVTRNPIGQCACILLLVSITMSTIDSLLNAASHSITTFFPKNFCRNNRLFTAIIGILATLIALASYKYGGEWMGYTVIIFSPLVIPFIAGVVGLKGSKKVFFASCSSFLVVVATLVFVFLKNPAWVFQILGRGSRLSWGLQLARLAWFIAIPFSTVVFFLAHYLHFGGFIWEDRTQNTLKSYRLTSMDWSWLTSPVVWANKKAKQYGTEPYWLGVLIYVSCFVPYLSTDKSLVTGLFVMGLRSIGIVMVIFLLIESLWAKKYLKYFNLLYYLTIFYCVPFTAIMTIWQDPRSGLVVGIMVSSIVLLVLLVDWQTFILFHMIALGFSMLFQKVWHGYFIPDFGTNGTFLLLANTLYCLAVCLIFARKKQIKYYLEKYNLIRSKITQAQQLQVRQSAHQQLADALDSKSSMITEISGIIKRQEQGVLNPSDVAKLKNAIAHLKTVRVQSLDYLPLNPSQGTFRGLMQAVSRALKVSGWHDTIALKLHDATTQQPIVADMGYLEQLVINSLKYQYQRYGTTQMHCYITPATISYNTQAICKQVDGYRISIADSIIQPTQQDYHFSPPNSMLTQGHKRLTTNLQITSAHLGVMEAKEDGNACLLTYVLPYDIHEVKPKIGTFTDEDLQAVTQLEDPADVTFLALADKKGMNRSVMELALSTCKHYHRHQVRKSGERFYLHPVAVATMLLEHTTDEDTIVAGLLHDLVEDTPYTIYQMTASFGNVVTDIVKDITNLYNNANRKIKLGKKQVFTALLEKSNEKTLLVKLMDRCHNIATIQGHANLAKRKQVAQETLTFFVPVAKRLGKLQIEAELVKQCHKLLDEGVKVGGW